MDLMLAVMTKEVKSLVNRKEQKLFMSLFTYIVGGILSWWRLVSVKKYILWQHSQMRRLIEVLVTKR